MGHGVTLRAFLSPLRHMEQLLLVTSCDSPSGIGASLRTDVQPTDGQTDVTLQICSILDTLWFLLSVLYV